MATTRKSCLFTQKLPRHLQVCESTPCRELALWCLTPEGQPHVHLCARHKAGVVRVFDLTRIEYVAAVL
jgi:hypothetical protein